MKTAAYLNAIGSAVPNHEVHEAFIDWAATKVAPERRRLFDRMAARSGIAGRQSALAPAPGGGSPICPGGFYESGVMPGTAARMQAYAAAAPDLCLAAIDDLRGRAGLDGITHLVVASCTGFVAPGIDQILAGRLGLSPAVERLLIGFMGCYAAVVALRQARHIVRSDPNARVLVINIELCTFHLQDTDDVEKLLAMLLFGDGASAALVTADAAGFELDTPFSATLPDSHELIRWDVTDTGFVMHLSGAVPQRIGAGLADARFARAATGGHPIEEVDAWAVHAGGRSILDAVEASLGLPPEALATSRAVLREHGNMSSATLMFVLQRMLAGAPVRRGVALAFGPGLAAEGFSFRSAA